MPLVSSILGLPEEKLKDWVRSDMDNESSSSSGEGVVIAAAVIALVEVDSAMVAKERER